jgi:hypothetical protein
MNNNQISCSNPACRVAETGKCVEGLLLEDCSYYGKESDVLVNAEDSVAAPISTALSLPSGAALNVASVAAVLGRGASRIIAVVGPRETGKTSLVASLYDLLQMGPIGDISFARSKTLSAFEMACHDARAASRRGIPHMERTRRGEVLFYHLELGGGVAKEGVTLLLGDRSGEEYSDVADDISAAADLVEVKRADAITVLIDGARLLDAGRRHNIRMDITMILQGLIDGGVLCNEQRIALVLTKLDLIQASQHRTRAEADFQGLHDHLSATLAGRFGRFEMFKIAASPATADMARGTGIAQLIDFWLAERPVVRAAAPTFPKARRAFARVEPLDE